MQYTFRSISCPSCDTTASEVLGCAGYKGSSKRLETQTFHLHNSFHFDESSSTPAVFRVIAHVHTYIAILFTLAAVEYFRVQG